MKIHRFIGDFYLNTEELVLADKELLNQWKNVLRLRTGSRIILADGKGHEADAVITSLTKKEATVSIHNVREEHREQANGKTLYASLIRTQNFEIICQKATELGIGRIVPLLTTRTVKTSFNRTRLEKIIKEAAEQSGRTTLPTLAEPTTFNEALSSVETSKSVLFDLTGSSFKASMEQIEISTSFFVGPEGGFTPEEVSQAHTAGITVLSLGDLVLRAETAAIVVSFLAVQ